MTRKMFGKLNNYDNLIMIQFIMYIFSESSTKESVRTKLCALLKNSSVYKKQDTVSLELYVITQIIDIFLQILH